MESVYLETTIVSYLTGRPSRDLIVAAHQTVTRDWWERERANYHCLISPAVLEEAAEGDADAAGLRLDALRDLAVIEITPEAVRLAGDLVTSGAVPQQAAKDAIHIAVATVAGVKYLLSWNCRHIANVHIAEAVGRLASSKGFRMPVLCTPLELTAQDRSQQ